MAIASSGGKTSEDQANLEPVGMSINSIPAALFILDKSGRIEDVNSIGVEICGADSVVLLAGRFLDDLVTVLPGMSLVELVATHRKGTVQGRLLRLDGKETDVQAICSPALEDPEKTLVLLTELPHTNTETTNLLQAYKKQKKLNQRLGEMLELGRTFSLHSDLNKVMNQIVRVVGESIGYGFVGLYLKEPSTGRMRVATYINANLDYNTFKMSNPGNDWDILMLITGNPSDMKKIGGTPIPVSFGMDAFQAGEGKSTPLRKTAVGDIWKVDGALLTLVQLNGSVTGGYLRVSDPMDNHCMNTADFLSPQSEIFCHQALWIYANQAAIAIENAYLIERARLDIDERARVEKDLAATQDELEKRILQRTLQLEQLNTELRTEIMEREVAQQELDQQTQFLRQVLDTNPTLIYARDRNGKYTLANDAAARFEGLAVEDILGKTDNELNHDLGQIIRWRHEDLDVMENRRDIILSEERIVDTHGIEHFLQTIKRPIVGPNGKINQVLGVSVEITARKKAEERVVQANSELAQAYDATIEGWSRALDLRDRETEGHSLRVTNMTLRLAKWMGIDQSEHLNLRRGALLHDIGKMGIPDEILFKKGTLSDDEWVIMRKHPSYAYEMLKPIDYLHPALFIPKYHHEKWDGSGYPEKLVGELIPLPARIFAIVDVWDALTSDRPYRVAWGVNDVLDYIKRNSGTHFDPKVVDTFIQNLDDIVFHNPVQ